MENNFAFDPNRAQKMSSLMVEKQDEIFSADPEKDSEGGDYGSAVTIVVFNKDKISRNDILQELIDDAEEKGGKLAESKKSRIEKTIDNLVESRILVEKDGMLEFAIEEE